MQPYMHNIGCIATYASNKDHIRVLLPWPRKPTCCPPPSSWSAPFSSTTAAFPANNEAWPAADGGLGGEASSEGALRHDQRKLRPCQSVLGRWWAVGRKKLSEGRRMDRHLLCCRLYGLHWERAAEEGADPCQNLSVCV